MKIINLTNFNNIFDKNNGFDKDKLLSNIEENNILFRKEIMDYLYSIYNLEVSVLREGAISKDVQDKLYNHTFYKQLVAYNIINRSFNILSSSEKLNNYINKNSSYMGLDFNQDGYSAYLFRMITDYEKSKLSFYQPITYSASELEDINDKKIKRIENQLEYNKNHENSYVEPIYDENDEPLFIAGPSYLEEEIRKIEFLEKELETLKSHTTETFQKESAFYEASAELKQEVLDLLLSDFGLDLDKDFYDQSTWNAFEERHKIKEYKTTTLHYK